MEWDSKSSAWSAMNKVELQDNMFESSTSTNNMFSIDLKLGMLEHMGDVPIDTLKSSRTLMTVAASSSASPSSALSKRGRPRSVGAHTLVYCSVDGCISDLSHGREYHRRHKVCERHSKTPVVHIAGREQRFCQQCSRFHSLGEFDDAKRSCRKRLDGHNRRRRKSQTETIYMSSSGAFQTSHTGNELLQFCCPNNWPVISEPGKALYGSHEQRVSHPISSLWSTGCVNGDKQLTYVPGINQQTLFQSSSNVISSTETRTSSVDGSSECALSLLSMCPTQSSTMFMGPNIPPLAMTSAAQLSRSTLHSDYSLAQFSCSKGMEDESSASLSSTCTTNSSYFFEAFHSGQDGLSGSRSSRVFPFSWQ